MSTVSRVTCAAVMMALLLGCEHGFPTAPSELTSGIVIYEHANYLGVSAHITSDVKDLDDFRARAPCLESSSGGSTTFTWNDCISSIRIAPGWRATVYENDDFKGESLEVSSDVANLQLMKGTCNHGGLNDCISSMRVNRP